MSDDVLNLDAAQRAALAADPGTDPAILAELGKDWRLVGDVAANPSTPDLTRRAIYADFPHLRPTSPPAAGGGGGPADAPADDAIARFRARSNDQARLRAAQARTAVGHGGGPSTVVVRDVSGRPVHVSADQVVVRGTNGLAITALVLGLVGVSLLAVIFGHVAKSQIARTGQAGRGMATAGLILGYLGMFGFIYLMLILRWNS